MRGSFELDLIIFPTIYYGSKSDKKWTSKLALEDLPKESCGQKNPNRKFGKKKRQNVIFKPPGLLVRQRLIFRVLKLYKYYLLSHKLESFGGDSRDLWKGDSRDHHYSSSPFFLFSF